MRPGVHRRTLPPRVDPDQLARDPLIHDRAESSRAMALIAALVVGAAIAHVIVTLVIGVASRVLHSGSEAQKDEKIEVTIQDQPPDKEEEKPEPPKEQEKAATDTEKETEQKTEKRQVEKKAPETTQPDEPAPPRVGLSLESTVGEGDGPAFAVGDTRLGSTAETAPDPNAKPPEKKPEPDEKPQPRQRNRRSQNIPTKGGDVLVKPKRSQRVEPDYPPQLRAQGIEANVVVQVQIDASGAVTKVDIIAPAPQAAFNDAARAAAMKEQFQPATRGGKPIPFTLSFTYRFRIGTK